MKLCIYKNINKFYKWIIILSYGLPSVAFAGLVNCDECGFNDLFVVANNVINFIFQLAVYLAAVMFAYAGILLLFSGGNESAKDKAKTIFGNVAIGLIFVAGAWLIIHLILTTLGYQGEWFGFDA